ncbi:hypothetical protein ACKI1I_17805 [Streptomyces turgidiscabies]|uniref:hypothetical protein n=1 Tax=Streptomyces TaxID=1883 RepID=UPI00117C97D8|nr:MULTISPECIES: hypothetical protein [Streptomyces]MDX3498027.1 hypothetical protein [Streptomyces turgidiscabies]
MTYRVFVDDSAIDPSAGIWFAVPGGFTELPIDILLAAPASAEANRLQKALTPLVEAIPDGVTRQQFIAQLASGQQLLRALREVGTVHCSLGVHRDDTAGSDSETLHSFFTVSWRDIAWSPRAVSAARAVATAEQHSHIEYLDLPSGPASMSETLRTPTSESGLPPTPLLQIYAYLPHPDCKRMAVLMLSTTAVARREQYREILRQIAELTSFESPLPKGPVMSIPCTASDR